MKKSILSMITLITLFINLSVTTFATNKSLDDNKVHMNQISDKITKLDSQISDLQNSMDKLQNTIDDNKAKVKSFEKQISNTEKKIKQTEGNLKDSEDVLSGRLRAMYKSGSYSGANYLAYVFEADGFSDMIGRIYALNKIIDADNEMITNLKNSQKSLENDINSLKSQKDAISKLNEENVKSLEEIKTNKSKLEKKKDEFNSELQSVQAQIKENEETLIKPYINVINSSSSISELSNAVNTLEGLIPQLSTSDVKEEVNDYILKGNNKIESLKAAEKPAPTPTPNPTPDNNNNNNGSGDNNNNSPSSSKKTFTMEATAYTGHGITASGTVPVRNPGGLSTVAVDPNVIPLGSKVYVSGYGYAIAADTGSAIKGNKIDLYVNSESDAYAFGRRTVTVEIISYPGEA